jgi:hypothetical protein
MGRLIRRNIPPTPWIVNISIWKFWPKILRMLRPVPVRRQPGRGSFENLTIVEEPSPQPGVVDILHRDSVVDGERGGRGGGLAENHENRLHADRAKSNMRR